MSPETISPVECVEWATDVAVHVYAEQAVAAPPDPKPVRQVVHEPVSSAPAASLRYLPEIHAVHVFDASAVVGRYFPTAQAIQAIPEVA